MNPLAQWSSLTPAELAAQQGQAQAVLSGYVQSSRKSFVSAMHVTSLVAGAASLLGALVAFSFMPSRRRRAEVVDGALSQDPVATELV